MKVAILTAGSSSDTKGIMNFVCEEARQMKKKENSFFVCDVYMIRVAYTRVLRGVLKLLNKEVRCEESIDCGKRCFEVGGVMFNNIWLREGLFNMFVRTKISHRLISNRNYRIVASKLKDYDYVIAHKAISHYVGYNLYRDNNIPFGAFWHGTELASTTFSNRYSYFLTKTILENACNNFFVSKALQNIAATITNVNNSQVIYTGPSEMFYSYTPDKKMELRKEFGLSDEDVVIAYAGNLIPVKNVLLLPEIFRCILDKCPELSIKFWIIGNGVQEKELVNKLRQYGVNYTFHGLVPPGRMPDYMNCVDVLLLISKKEGLGLVCLEAMKCGARVFGSMAGGIPEVIGKDHCVELDNDFVENIASLVVNSICYNKDKVLYPEDIFSWESAVNKIMISIGV